MAAVKTNVLRILDKAKVPYTYQTYEVKDGKIDGVAVSEKLGLNKEQVFKTLVVHGKSSNCYVCVIPVESELDLKKVSMVTGEKKVEMLPLKDLLKTTGYMRGGCSPIGMKKQFGAFVHESANDLNEMTMSAGKIGVQVTLSPKDLQKLIPLQFKDIIV